MRCIALMNQKGGVGKTTTTVNLGAALAELGQRVCLIDLDPQAHLTINYGMDPRADVVNLYTVDSHNQELLRRATETPALPESWKDYFRKRLWQPDG